MARLQELQYTVAGGAKVVSGVSLSPRSTRGYLRTSIRCKQETVRQASPSQSHPVPSDHNWDFTD
jgi:microtubule-binding protein TANGLED1